MAVPNSSSQPRYIPAGANVAGKTYKNVTAANKASGIGASRTTPSVAPKPSAAKPSNVNIPKIKQTFTDNGMPISQTAQSLFVDPTPIYQPALDFLTQQRTQANERYAQNKADIANIFGTLTTMRQADQEKIRKQFEDSIVSQQTALATRTAEARKAQQGAVQAATQVGAERGTEMEGTVAPQTALAAEQGIADSNAFQTSWEGMQRALGSQTQADLANAIAGYGFQEAQAARDLQGSLEGTLNQLAGQGVDVNTALAEAIYGGKSKVAEANYNETMNARAAAAQAAQAAASNAARIRAAEINAANRIVDYPNDATGVDRYLRDQGVTDTNAFWDSVDSTDLTGVRTSSQAYSKWLKANASKNPSQTVKTAARDWFNRLSYDRSNTGAPDYSGLGVQTPK